MSHLTEFITQWEDYGAVGTERSKRKIIAVGGILVLCTAIAIISGLLPIDRWLNTKSNAIVQHFRPRDFSYAMTILTALIAAACTAFFGVIHPDLERGSTLGQDPRWSLTALIISLVAAIAATMSFAGVYAFGSETAPARLPLAEFHMLTLAFLQLGISLGLVSVSVVPVVSGNRPGPFLGSVVSAISTFWWVPAGWIVLFSVAVPALVRPGIAGLCSLLFLTMAQIYFPHGWIRQRNEEAYLRILRTFRHLSYFSLGYNVIITGYIVMLDVLNPMHSAGYYAVTLMSMFIWAGVALWLYSVSVEGQRKFDRYVRTADGRLCPAERSPGTTV